jgi:hypothetical protein
MVNRSERDRGFILTGPRDWGFTELGIGKGEIYGGFEGTGMDRTWEWRLRGRVCRVGTGVERGGRGYGQGYVRATGRALRG